MKTQLKHSIKAGVIAALALGLLSACNDDDSPETGTMSLAVTDAPVHNAAEVWVQFSGITVKRPNAEPQDIDFDGDVIDVDLMALTGSNSQDLLNEEEMIAGPYNWIRRNVNADLDGELDSYVMTDEGEMVELEVVSQQGLQLSSGFTITANQHTSFIIDWDLNQGLTAPLNQEGWKLRPSLRITDETEYGTIAGTVDEGLLTAEGWTSNMAEDIGNEVYIYEGADVTPDDIDLGEGNPVATGDITQDMNGFYTYSVTYLSPGEYTVAVTCQGLDDIPDEENDIAFAGVQNATVVDGEEEEVNF
ncbi:MAG: DUF4382 domain-containing protein [Pseudomonadales bacterium]|nr:DUF4382 domain-containing protein [Pseudomonadales bacterium]